MSEIVKCDVCGQIYNSRYLGSHKRRAHSTKGVVGSSGITERDAVEQILSLFARLSRENREYVLSRLAADAAQKTS